LSFTLLAYLLPQKNSYYLASLLPYVYLPLFVLLNVLFVRKKLKLVGLMAFTLIAPSLYYGAFNSYASNQSQLKYISEMSRVLSDSRLSYLDGVGIFPRQQFIRCFASPDDEIANAWCTERIQNAEADVVIITGRLNAFVKNSSQILAQDENYRELGSTSYIKKKSPITYTGDLNIIPLIIFL
jgi:hypothetical protein